MFVAVLFLGALRSTNSACRRSAAKHFGVFVMPNSCKRRPAFRRCRRRDVIVIAVIAAIGTVLSGVCVAIVSDAEAKEADNAFQDLFWPQLSRLHSFLQLQLLTLRAVSDALSVLPRDISLETTKTVRVSAKLYCNQFRRSQPRFSCSRRR